MPRQYEVDWYDQNTVKITDHVNNDEFYIPGGIEWVRVFESLSEHVADTWMNGFIYGINACDSILRHSTHNFIQRD